MTEKAILEAITTTLGENQGNDVSTTAMAIRHAIGPYLAGGGVEIGENGTVGEPNDRFADIWRFEVRDGWTIGNVECAYIADGESNAHDRLQVGKTVRLNLYLDDGENMLTGDATLTKVRSVEGARQDGFWRTRFEFKCDTPLESHQTDANSWHFMKPDPSKRISREE